MKFYTILHILLKKMVNTFAKKYIFFIYHRYFFFQKQKVGMKPRIPSFSTVSTALRPNPISSTLALPDSKRKTATDSKILKRAILFPTSSQSTTSPTTSFNCFVRRTHLQQFQKIFTKVQVFVFKNQVARTKYYSFGSFPWHYKTITNSFNQVIVFILKFSAGFIELNINLLSLLLN